MTYKQSMIDLIYYLIPTRKSIHLMITYIRLIMIFIGCLRDRHIVIKVRYYLWLFIDTISSINFCKDNNVAAQAPPISPSYYLVQTNK